MEVTLYVYDLTRGMARAMSQQLLGTYIDAVYHTAIILENVEYFFGAGIQTCRAGSTHHGRPMEVISLGKTQLPKDVIQEYLQSLREIYTPESYDLFTHNCNNFSHDFAMFLLGRGIPEHITNLPQRVLDTPFGQMLRPQIDASMRSITQAPVPNSNTLANGSHNGYPSNSVSKGGQGQRNSSLLKLSGMEAFLFKRLPPIEKLVAKLGGSATDPAFASLLKFIRDGTTTPSNAAIPEMQPICKTYQSLSSSLPLDKQFAAVDLLRYSVSDARLAGYLAEERDQQTVYALAKHVEELDTCPHNLRLVTIQLLCNSFSSKLFPKTLFDTSHEQILLQSIIRLVTTSLLDEEHTTSRVASAWLAFNLTDAMYAMRDSIRGVSVVDDARLQLAASILERLQTEQNDEAVRALLLAFGRLLSASSQGNELNDLTEALDARKTLLGCKVEVQLAKEVASLL